MNMDEDQCDLDIQRLLRAEIRDLRFRHSVEIDLVHAAYASRLNEGTSPTLPEIDEQCRLLVNSLYYDEKWYTETYPEVQDSGMSPAEHYVRKGAFEGQNPGPHFDNMAYYLGYPDVAKDGWPALVHFEALGKAQGRRLA